MNDFLQLAREYYNAAELLYDRGNKSRPVAFCYIQSAELLLKGWLQQQGSLSESLRKTHDLYQIRIIRDKKSAIADRLV